MAVNDNSVPTTNKHSLYAAYVFGSIIFIFFIWVFFFPPAVLLDEQRKILAIFSALLCAFFTVFFVGTLNIEGDWLGFSIKGGGGLAVFVIVLWWWFDSSTPPIPPIPPSTQETIINARNGDKIAQYELGLMYQFASGGLIKDIDQSKAWYEKSARQGYDKAIWALRR